MNEFFPVDLETKHLSDGRKLVLLRDFVFVDPLHGEIRVPALSPTDLASIPRLFWIFLPPFGRYKFGAVIHDFLYCQRPFGKTLRGWRQSDRVMWRAMKLAPAPVSAFARVAIYFGLLLGGWVAYFRD